MASRSDPVPVEESIIQNLKPNKIYQHDFGNGRYFQVVHEDEEGFEVKLASKTLIKVLYIFDKKDFQGIEIVKVINGNEKQKISLSNFNIKQIRAFLEFISTTTIEEIPEAKMSLAEETLTVETKRRIKELLVQEGGEELIRSLIDEGIVTSRDIVNTAYRKRQLETFKRMLDDPEYWKEYATSESISASKEEKVWQHFFDTNDWIFGYGLEYRFNGILQREFYASGTEADGSESVISDYLVGDPRFTTFVEIKKPSTPIFANTQNRSLSWKLSNDLIDSVTQILEQKASGQIKLEGKPIYDSKGNLIEQKSYDSKVILIIGNWSKIDAPTHLEKMIKEKTFELFRRDSRNIEILTYDELYERAHFIVHNESSTDSVSGLTERAIAVATPAVKAEEAFVESPKMVATEAVAVAEGS